MNIQMQAPYMGAPYEEDDGKHLSVRPGCLYRSPVQGWIHLPMKHVPRSAAGLCVWRDRLVLAGGRGQVEQEPLNHVEALELDEDGQWVWKEMPPMTHCRLGGSLACVNDTLVALGGADGSQQVFTSVVEIFDPELNCWHSMEHQMPFKYHACHGVGLPRADC